MIEEIDEISHEKKINPTTSVADAVKLTSNLAKNFSQIADILTSHLSTDVIEEDKKSPDNELTSENSLINNLVESAMNKKLEEIKNNIVAPLQQMNTLFGITSSFVNKKLNSLSNLKNQSINTW
ncbi:unnamed protein product [Brachionus calyciflorus]|uniref:Uncharacterized protein n=1 Tax=Brachionus calyciflorus TaxID=104777 RepID=A0A814A8I8_9BILA|nr:unnamed protein product [Brachionus calyciflorus]